MKREIDSGHWSKEMHRLWCTVEKFTGCVIIEISESVRKVAGLNNDHEKKLRVINCGSSRLKKKDNEGLRGIRKGLQRFEVRFRVNWTVRSGLLAFGGKFVRGKFQVVSLNGFYSRREEEIERLGS
jgi:hypothetical protein